MREREEEEMSTKSYQKGTHTARLLEHVVNAASIYTYQHADSKHGLAMLKRT